MPSRREALALMGGTALTGAFAGCTDVLGGGGDTLTIASSPTPTFQAEMRYVTEQTDIADAVMEEAGYEYDLNMTWDARSLFLGGNADLVPSNSTIEAAGMVENQELDVTVTSKRTPQHTGLYVREGGAYDPDVAGGKQAAIDNLVDDQANFGIGGWGLSTIPAYRIIFSEKYGYEFDPDGDFNVFTAEFPALARLLADQEIAAGGSGPPYNLWDFRNELKPLFWMQVEMMDLGFPGDVLGISNGVTQTAFAEENPEAIKAYLAILKHVSEYMQDNLEEVAQDPEIQETLGASSAEEAQWFLAFRYRAENSPNEFPATLTEMELTDEHVEAERDALSEATDLGALEGSWENGLSFEQYDLTEYLDVAAEAAE